VTVTPGCKREWAAGYNTCTDCCIALQSAANSAAVCALDSGTVTAQAKEEYELPKRKRRYWASVVLSGAVPYATEPAPSDIVRVHAMDGKRALSIMLLAVAMPRANNDGL